MNTNMFVLLFNMIVLTVICLAFAWSANGQSLNFDIFNYLKKIDEPKTKCQQQMNRYIDGLREGEYWAYSMWDASSKLNSGILRGQLKDVGNFDECINLEFQDTDVGQIIGKHCTYGMKVGRGEHVNEISIPMGPAVTVPEFNVTDLTTKVTDLSVVLFLSVCLPDACNPSDLKHHLPVVSNLVNISYNDERCTTKNASIPFDGLDIAVLSLFGVVFVLVILSTAYEVLTKQKASKTDNEYLLAFSLVSNVNKLLQIERSPDTITCIDGIRVLSMLWVILGHRIVHQMSTGLMGVLDVLEWLYEWYTFYFFGAASCVDSFFFLAGVVLSYVFLKTMNRAEVKFNLFQFYLQRFIRLTPALLMVLLVQLSLARHLGNGPIYEDMVKPMVDSCRQWWWSVLLYNQNYLNTNMSCLCHTWHLCVDMQLFILSPLILIPLQKERKRGFFVIGALICVSMFSQFATIYFLDLIPESKGFTDFYYVRAHTRATPWLIGLLLGAILHEYKNKKIDLHWMIYSTAWIITIPILACIIYYSNPARHSYDTWNTATNLTFSNNLWSVGLAWIVFACCKGFGGLINWFLSLPLFHIIAKLSYSMYLVHNIVITTFVARTRTNIHWSNLDVIHLACGDIAVTLLISFFWVLLFEFPVAAIQKQMLKRNIASIKQQKKQEGISDEDIKNRKDD